MLPCRPLRFAREKTMTSQAIAQPPPPHTHLTPLGFLSLPQEVGEARRQRMKAISYSAFFCQQKVLGVKPKAIKQEWRRMLGSEEHEKEPWGVAMGASCFACDRPAEA